MYLASLELRDFRRYEEAQLTLGPGVTVLEGLNGAGKTTVLEAVAWAALGRSFRGVPDSTLVRHGTSSDGRTSSACTRFTISSTSSSRPGT